jgi:hypothetical protein
MFMESDLFGTNAAAWAGAKAAACSGRARNRVCHKDPLLAAPRCRSKRLLTPPVGRY